MHVWGQIFQRRLTVTDRLDVDDEPSVPGRCWDPVIQPTSTQLVGKLRLVNSNQRTVMKQKVLRRALPRDGAAVLIELHSTAGYDVMNVGMIDGRVAAPGVQHAEEPKLAVL